MAGGAAQVVECLSKKHEALNLNLKSYWIQYLKKIIYLINKHIKIVHISQVVVAHACNPSYSGGRIQEDHK
jgi:hypothetical protein